MCVLNRNWNAFHAARANHLFVGGRIGWHTSAQSTLFAHLKSNVHAKTLSPPLQHQQQDPASARIHTQWIISSCSDKRPMQWRARWFNTRRRIASHKSMLGGRLFLMDSRPPHLCTCMKAHAAIDFQMDSILDRGFSRALTISNLSSVIQCIIPVMRCTLCLHFVYWEGRSLSPKCERKLPKPSQ